MREIYKSTTLAAFMLLGCGGAPEGGQEAREQAAAVGQVRQNVVWLASTDPLVPEHLNWHTLACGTAGARKCTDTGKDFLDFHRNYLNRLRVKHEQAGRAESERTPWERLDEDSAVWAATPASVRTAYDNLINNRDPNNGNQPFASVNAFGMYLEANLHNPLHGIVNGVYPSDAPTIGNFMSPRSSLFFKIHGLVERLYLKFQRSKILDEKWSNMLFRNTSTGVNQTSRFNINAAGQISQFGSNALPTIQVDNCDYYMGAVADLDLDGSNDIIWHGPGCTSIVIWRMNGALFRSTMIHALPPPDGQWALIGAGDFNQDLRPDLAWANVFGGEVVVWYMQGPLLLQSGTQTRTFTFPSNNFVGQLVLSDSQSSTARPPGFMARDLFTGQNRIFWFTRTGSLASTTTLTTVADFNWFPLAAGHYHQNKLPVSDIVWWNQLSGQILVWAGNSAGTTYTQTGGSVTGTPSSAITMVQGAR